MFNGPSDVVLEEIGIVSGRSMENGDNVRSVLSFINGLPTSGATKLRKMIFETNELIVCPGVYDGLSARTALEVGFHAMYMVRLRCRQATCRASGHANGVLTDWCRYHRLAPRPARLGHRAAP